MSGPEEQYDPLDEALLQCDRLKTKLFNLQVKNDAAMAQIKILQDRLASLE